VVAVSAQVAIDAKNVSVEYRLRARSGPAGMLRTRVERKLAVAGVSMTIAEGESVGLIGRNGSGKSTLLRAFCGLAPLHGGTVIANTRPFLLGVNAVLRAKMSGRDNAELGLLAQGVDRERIPALLEEIHNFTELDSAFDQPMATYSSGMRSRLHFSIATALRPKTLLIDEALAVGDREFKRKSEARLEELRAEASALVVVSHNLTEVNRMCTRTIWLQDGEVVLDGVSEDVIEAYEAATSAEPEPSD
jgi:teichoic acid transport system ATP-binding protein